MVTNTGSENFTIPKYWKVKLAKRGISKFGWRGGGGGQGGIYLWVAFERQFRFKFRIVKNMSVPECYVSLNARNFAKLSTTTNWFFVSTLLPAARGWWQTRKKKSNVSSKVQSFQRLANVELGS
jgi:hypothetical protein